MLRRKSRVLKNLSSGKSCGMVKVNLSDPRVIEIVGLSGAEAVWICGEHVLNDWINLENQIRAAELNDMDSIVRVPKGSYSDYIKPLEGGASGIIIPNVETEDEAREIVAMTRFHPLGERAIDGGNRDGSFATMPIDTYIEYSNSEQYIVLQIESPKGIANVEAISQVDGINFLFFGPGDYAHKIGKVGKFDDPEVVEARAKVEQAAMKYGKQLMTTGDSPLLASGDFPHLVCIGADVVGLYSYLKSQYADKVTSLKTGGNQ
jgi:4-hydroxy-2-oxoheptanedioate aldolase